ncbi:MAG: histidinol dehydrogenase [Spirochaetales bacterium]|nr:histidinol dehydrogenase [Spirochaetales bacterium]
MKINLFEWDRLSAGERATLCRRVEASIPAEVMKSVRAILAAVRKEGDAAVVRYTRRFDGARLEGRPLRVTEEEFEEARRLLPPAVQEAVRFAADNVRRAHQGQKPKELELVEVKPGVYAGERWVPLDSVGLYVPHGRGSFPSVMYMQALPAAIAGVPRVACVTPPDRDGRVDPAVLFTAQLCGVREVYRVGGVQGIGALAFGTAAIPRVDKILGPGSLYVAAAKQELRGEVDVGLPAGPSESIILADAEADPERLALDLMIEAEHGSDSSAFLVTPSREVAGAVREALPRLLGELPEERAGFVRDVLAGFGGIVLTGDLDGAVEFVNAYAPEHLQLACREPFDLLPRVVHAGEILLGQNTPFSVANYAGGCNNVIPTGGWARTRSPLSVREFMKSSSVLYVTEAGLEGLRSPVISLARYEGFAAHALALERRRPGRNAGAAKAHGAGGAESGGEGPA